MLVAGRTRLTYIAGLTCLGFLVILVFTYNPQLPENSATRLQEWAKISQEKAPGWMGQSTSHPSAEQKAHPEPQRLHLNDLPSANPDPLAAVPDPLLAHDDPRTTAVPSSSQSEDDAEEKKSERQEEKSAHQGHAQKTTDDQKQMQFILDHMGEPLTLNAFPFSHEGVNRTDVEQNYNEITSSSTQDGSYFHLHFPGYMAYNPSLIPHPRKENTWIMTAQRLVIDRGGVPSGWSDEIACAVEHDPTANYNMTCIEYPRLLAIAATEAPRDGCPDNLSHLHMNIGPHDARVFMGPPGPYIMYGSQSQFTCFGQWVQDFRMTYDWGHFRNYSDPFDKQTEIQRPGGNGPMEKNYFLFWDMEHVAYAHYDTAPRRSYATIEPDGSTGSDLARHARQTDQRCWQKHQTLNPLPPVSETDSSIHQASNSLSVILCERTDPSCTKTADNTVVIHIYQHKIGNGLMHARYEPFVMLFNRTFPFPIHAISAQPLWIRGRSSKNEMLYVTSINWKVASLHYEGYLDDVIYLGFGVEDRRPSAIDVVAKDLLADLMPCESSM